MQVTSDATTRGRQMLFGGFFFTVLLFLLYQFYLVFSFFLVPLSWAGLLALVFYPLYAATVRLLRGREGLAALSFTLLVILGWLQSLKESLPGRIWERLAPVLREWKVDPATVGLRAGDTVSKFLVSQVGLLATNALRFVGNFFLVAFALFFCFRDGERMVRAFRDLLPMEARHKDLILVRLHEALSAGVQGTLLTAAVQGFLAGFGFWLLSVPFSILLGGATALLSMIPFGGPAVWIGATIYLVLAGEWVRAGLMALWGMLIVGSADNIIRPMVIGGRTQLPTIFLFFGILGGLQAYGFLGVFVGPVLIAILVAFLRIYREEYAGRTAADDAS